MQLEIRVHKRKKYLSKSLEEAKYKIGRKMKYIKRFKYDGWVKGLGREVFIK